MSRGGIAQTRSAPADALPASSRGYWADSESPLASLLFLLPLILVYEMGAGEAHASAGHGQQVIAFVLLRQFFGFFGATAAIVPALAIAAILLCWHILRDDAWKVHPGTLLGMTLESGLLALPLLLISLALPRCFPLSAARSGGNMLVLYIGAGVYEELVFRLILVTFIAIILREGFEMRKGTTAALAVVTAAVIFSAYHYLSPAEPTFQWRTFVFRSVAGIYFGVLFLTRGFGITAGSHAAYDVLVLFLAYGVR